ncbi:hypothetical protein KO488_12635 [Poseidonibacter lekithochrous]|uniref:hypothetical protein n=1 Tax=Poseidonibacter TaxID=2321187 RepID=UPI001C08B4B7|nr:MULTISPECIES: hypothetical protein [Poseidonibacter]MBU3015608.1 hypothetical protein [Poseidonibacter lekithochrous]MDO6828908.1 hypothetical protein [Poseidonibacter sp. 1_MG-2023]
MSKKKTKQIKPNIIEKQKYLKTYLLQKRFTLKDLKCEVILIMCDMLIDNYLNAEESGESEELIENLSINEKNLIFNNMKSLQKDIQKSILTIDKIQYIINNQQKDKKSLSKAKLIDSSHYFYNLCAEKLKFSIIAKTNDTESLKWIPDLIVILLIQDMKERGYSFNKFKFIDEYDLDKLFSIYLNTNILLKKKNKITLFSKEKTIINIMENVSLDIVEELIKSKYK